MQQLVATGALDTLIKHELQLPSDSLIEWRSPIQSDDFAEYRDESFLQRIGLGRLAAQLRSFWPSRGPQWDGLALTSDGKVILVEAKAHASELRSTCAAGPKSMATIHRSLDVAKRHFGARGNADWTSGFYQYANRLAHLKFLHDLGVDAHLFFIYFLNDSDMGRTTRAQLERVLDDCHEHLGLPNGSSLPGVHSLYVDVTSTAHPPAEDQSFSLESE